MDDPLRFQADYFGRNPCARSVMELFESLPHVSFYAKDTASRFVQVNHLVIEALGASDECEVLGRSDRDFHPPVMAEAYIEEDRRVMAGRRPIPNQTWLVFRADRLPQWYVSSKVPLFDPAGEVIGIAGAMYSIEQPAEHARHFRELSAAIRHIDRHHAENISMAEMAALSGMSATHFNRRFKQLLQMTPTAYLRSVRVHAARRLLGATHRGLAEIGQQCGFTDQSHFTLVFRESTGMTPGAYRKRFRK